MRMQRYLVEDNLPKEISRHFGYKIDLKINEFTVNFFNFVDIRNLKNGQNHS